MYQIILAFRSLMYRKRQYLSLFLICLFGTSVSIFCLFLSRGMMNSLNQKAEVYYGGEFVIMSNAQDERCIYDYPAIIEKIKVFLPEEAKISVRYDFSVEDKAYFYFEGEEARQRVIKGVDFDCEEALFSKFNFTDGNAQIKKGSNGILINDNLSKKFGIKAGDSLTLFLRNINGYINTVDVVVNGIFMDSSVFGLATVYMDLNFLQTVYGRPDWFVNRICVDYPKITGLEDNEVPKLQKNFESVLKMHPLVDDKNIFYDSGVTGSDFTYSFIPLKANLNDVKILKNAMYVIITLIIFFLVLIIIVGIGSTFRIIVMKRINEIGVYMALGMKKSHIMKSLVLESLFLLLAGCASGFIIAGLLCRIISLIRFTFVPSFSIFLTKGFLKPAFDGKGLVLVLCGIIMTTLLAVCYSVKKCVNIMPCEAISANE